jgi:hypothetical protein
MYFKEILDAVSYAIDDSTLSSTGTNSVRTKGWVNEFLFNDFLPRFNWLFCKKTSNVDTVASTATISLPRWVNHPSTIKQLKNLDTKNRLIKLSEDEADERYGGTTATGEPMHYVPKNRTRTTYSTGTISATSGTKTITGSGTDFVVAGIEQYDIIQVGLYAYTVNTVNSTTSITTFENIITTIAPSTAYIALLDRWVVTLYPTPDDAYEIKVVGNGIVPKLVNDYDVPTLPDEWHWVLSKGAEIKARKHNNEDAVVPIQELEAVIKRFISQEVREEDRLERIRL